MVQGNVGPYKVVYQKDKYNVLYATMFDTIDAALDFAHKLPGRWLLSQKIGHDKDDYAWKVLPYGAYTSFKIGLKIDHARYIIIFILALVIIYYSRNLFSFKPKLPTY